MALRDRIAKARRKFWDFWRKRRKAKPGGKRRKKLKRKQDFWDALKEKLVARLKRRNRKPSLKRVNVNLGNWGGSGSVMDQFVEPFMIRRGLPLGSGKRTPAENARVGGSPYSDHLTTKTTTDARDFPTYSGEDDARALAHAMGNSGWQPNSYASFYFTCDGYRFRAQILWGSAIAHGDHVHVGISRA